jgi:hypothetical protein
MQLRRRKRKRNRVAASIENMMLRIMAAVWITRWVARHARAAR